MQIPLNCVDPNHRGEVWALDFSGDTIRLLDGLGRVDDEFGAEEALARFRMPSFGDIKYFGVRTPDRIRQFKVSRQDMRRIHAVLAGTVATAGDAAIDLTRAAAIRELAIGIVVSLVALAILVAMFPGIQTRFVLVLFAGMAFAGKGAVGYRRYLKARQFSKSAQVHSTMYGSIDPRIGT